MNRTPCQRVFRLTPHTYLIFVGVHWGISMENIHLTPAGSGRQ